MTIEDQIKLAECCLWIAVDLTETKSQYLDRTGISGKNTWADRDYHFDEGKLSIGVTLRCDGPVSAYVSYDGDLVLSYDNDMDCESRQRDKDKIRSYKSGEWEKDILRLSKRRNDLLKKRDY